MEALRLAGDRLEAPASIGSTLYSSGEPCLMCLGAVLQCPSIRGLVWAVGPVSPAGSAYAAVRRVGYNEERSGTLSVLPEPSAAHRERARGLLRSYFVGRVDPRAEWFAEAAAGPDP
jgi:tRNA(Arg) A34 adenosine deaminase TadA